LKDTLEVGKPMRKYNKSQLPVTLCNYFKLITNVHPYNARQTKTGQFALPKEASSSGLKMLKYSAIKILSQIPLQIKINRVWKHLQPVQHNMLHYSDTRNIVDILPFLLVCINHVH